MHFMVGCLGGSLCAITSLEFFGTEKRTVALCYAAGLAVVLIGAVNW